MSKSSAPIMKVMDGNEAAADVAFRLSEVCAIYPITPSSTMAELADQWKNEGRTNLWGHAPCIMEMQSEGGAAGAVHGALQTGSLSTTFTASQGLMLMIPNMHKIAGELTPTVFHVAARSLAAQALSIFGDHQDVMAVRNTGFAQLAANSVQEAHDMALIAHASTLKSRVPFVHFFDGFRTSHEVNKISWISDDVIRAMIKDEWVREHRVRSLNPENPVIRGTAQNPDVYFQGRESSNSFYNNTPTIVQQTMDEFSELTGRNYQLVEYFGHPKAERVIVVMGSASQTVKQVVNSFADKQAIGVLVIRLYRPFPKEALLAALPSNVRCIGVLDRTKEPGSLGEPLYLDISTAVSEAFSEGRLAQIPKVVGGRYGLSSKEFTPAMVMSVFDMLSLEPLKNHFTVGINDDVTHSSLELPSDIQVNQTDTKEAVFYGLGADGTVGANKNSIKIINQEEALFAQGYFVYDSKKSGSQTESHVRYGPTPIDAPYLVSQAGFVAIHQFNFVEQQHILDRAAQGATVLINAPFSEQHVWQNLPAAFQQTIIEKELTLYSVDAYAVASEVEMGNRINTIMQTCFFYLADILPQEEAIALIKHAIEKSYAKKGRGLVEKNYAAVDQALSGLHEIKPGSTNSSMEKTVKNTQRLPDFVRDVTMPMIEGLGDLIPVSQIPVDGTYPSATTQWEKRGIAQTVPQWDSDLCIQCGNCVVVCPHAAIRSKFYHQDSLQGAPAGFNSVPTTARGFPETRFTLQVYAEDCTGCDLCIQACPAISEVDQNHKAINMVELSEVIDAERENVAFFEMLEYPDRSQVDFSTIRGAQFLQPLFEFSGACAGCGETPYLKMISQLFGDRMLVANATGCSSIYGGNLPTTPWAKNEEGRGPAWANSLFEDNAEFGLGFRLTADHHHHQATSLLTDLKPKLEPALVDDLLNSPQQSESQLRLQRSRVEKLKSNLQELEDNDARQLESIVDHLVRRSVWIVGGDGWAYDIGYGGLDHVMATGRDVNILVMDTEVYSNTGGQMSKATPLGAVAKFSAGGKPVGKKDLALQAIAYGNVYVARIALGANPQQALQAFREAEAYPGTSIILAYSHCIAHGIKMDEGLRQQKMAVASGHWPLLRYNPLLRKSGMNPFELDSLRPSISLKDYRQNEGRYQQLIRSNPDEAERLLSLANEALDLRWQTYEDMATRKASDFHPMYE